MKLAELWGSRQLECKAISGQDKVIKIPVSLVNEMGIFLLLSFFKSLTVNFNPY